MEAATGAPAAAEPTTAEPEGTEAEAQQAPPQADPWQQQIEGRLGEVSDNVRQALQTIAERLPEPEAEPVPDFATELQSLYEETGGMPDPQQLNQLVQSQVQREIQQAIAPVTEEIQAMRQERSAQEIDALQQQFPELQDPAAAAALADRVVEQAAALGVAQPTAGFVRMVHLAEKASQSARGETPAGQGPDTSLETGGGAAPGQGEADPWDAIQNAGRAQSGPLW